MSMRAVAVALDSTERLYVRSVSPAVELEIP